MAKNTGLLDRLTYAQLLRLPKWARLHVYYLERIIRELEEENKELRKERSER